jgi:hypothetical protein
VSDGGFLIMILFVSGLLLLLSFVSAFLCVPRPVSLARNLHLQATSLTLNFECPTAEGDGTTLLNFSWGPRAYIRPHATAAVSRGCPERGS